MMDQATSQHFQGSAELMAGSQQPLSLMTINANPNRKEDLLIIRILEASERKMQLIKKLLTPEQFNSIQFDKYSNQDHLMRTKIDDRQQRQFNVAGSLLDQTTSNSVPTQFIDQPNGFAGIERAKSLGGNSTRAPPRPASIPAKTSYDLHSNLAKKREALEFFFLDEQTSFTDNKQDNNLAIELRSGYYLSGSIEHETRANELLKSEPFSLTDRLIGLLSFMGISYDPTNLSETPGTTEQEEQFENLHRSNNIGEPYTRKRNIVAMRKRLQAVDKELNKVLNQDCGQSAAPQGQYSNLVDLAKMHKNHTVSSNQNQQQQHQIKVVEPIGHFNTIHLVGPRKFVTSEQVELILQEPSSRSLMIIGHCLWQSSRQNLCEPTTGLLAGVSGALELNLSTLLIINHKLMLAEERAALRVVELVNIDRSSGDRKEQLLSELAKLVELYEIQQEPDMLTTVVDRLREVCENLVGMMKQIILTQQEISVVSSELDSFRTEQEFNSTSITISGENPMESSSSLNRVRALMIRLINHVNTKSITRNTLNDEFINFCNRFLEEFLNNFGTREQVISINFLGLKLTPDKECPANELERRRLVQDWLSSIRLRLLIGDKYLYECHLDQTKTQKSAKCGFRLPYGIDLKEQNHRVVVPSVGSEGSLELKIEIFRPNYRLIPLISQLEATATIQLPMASKQTHCIPLKFTNSETSLAQLKFESGPKAANGGKFARGLRCRSNELIDLLYRRVFKLTSQNWLYDSETKFAQLINKCDLSILAQMLGYKVSSRRRRRDKFELDPFINYLDDGIDVRCEKWTRESTRQALIVWRWVNSLTQLIYLSERENTKNYSLQSGEFRSKLEAIVVAKHVETDGFRSIEQMRSLAVDYIKEYEVQLKEVLKCRTEERGLIEQQQQLRMRSNKLKDLLREPELRMAVDLSGLVRVARSFVPKRTANRPLLPRRRRAGGNRLLLKTGAPMQLASDTGVSSGDTEAQQQQELGTRWRNLLGGHGASRLQLVVTIQQATNVPMRIVQARPMNPATRPNSPFGGPIGSPSSHSFMSQLMQPPGSVVASPQPPPPIQYLVPPTTYVEIVFQRRQQASSLAQGKSPAWNETLFFPVDFATTPAGNQLREADQLIDEFLQLNLYDYHCYLQEPAQNSAADAFRLAEQTSDLSTLPMVSAINDPMNHPPGGIDSQTAAVLGAQRVQTARQRIERHLLGSMRVPLTTLMSSGRIDGSFALKQPLLLDNYQFEPEVSPAMMMRANSPLIMTTTPQGEWQPNSRGSLETRINLFITLDPPISMPIHLLHLPTGSHESERVLEAARLWEVVAIHHRHQKSSVARQQSGLGGTTRPFGRHQRGSHGPSRQVGRHIRALVLQRDAKYCLISRLLVALEPPAELSTQLDQSRADWSWQAMHSLARFVSLMSPLKYGLLGMRLLASSLWFDSGQLVEKSLGGPEEKAVLLCNYFLFLGIASGLLLGESVPEGRCVQVIVWHEQSSCLIEDQLQLQAANLLESISQLAGAPNPNPNPNRLGQRRPIDRSDFISRLPIQMKANSVQLFDPNSGQSYTLSNQHQAISLVSVGSIVTMENVYANIQSVENPFETSYDIRSKNFWFPLFDSSLTGRGPASSGGGGSGLSMGTKQNPQSSWRHQLARLEAMRKSIGHPIIGPILSPDTKLNYYKFSAKECDELRETIERVVKSHLLKWRPDRPTYFNRTLSRLCAEKLALFEGGNFNTGDSGGDRNNNDNVRPEWRSELANFIKNEITMTHLSSSGGLNSRQVISCPINMPYTSMRTIVDSIFASGIHNADMMLLEPSQLQANSSCSQFLVACHVHPYPARVMSVWLYVAAIIPNAR